MNSKIRRFSALVAAGMLCASILAGCAQDDTLENGNGQIDKVQEENGQQADNGAGEEIGYEIERKSIKAEGIKALHYPQVIGYEGELLQDYMNQSIENAAKIYADPSRYSNVDIDYEIKRMDSEILSVVFEGTAQPRGLGRDVTIMQSVNLDVETSNEIDYDALVTDDGKMRQVLSKKLEETRGMIFEAEGIRVYYEGEDIVFFYMPLDDSADEFIQIKVNRGEIQDILNDDFGEKPAS